MGPLSPIRSFETFSPSFDEISDWLWDHFSTVEPTKSGRVEPLTLEVPLTREQARRGGNARVLFRPGQLARHAGDMDVSGSMIAIDARVKE